MEPQQKPNDSYASPKDSSAQYGFIMDSPPPPPVDNSGAKRKRIIVVVAGVLLLGLIAMFVASLLAPEPDMTPQRMANLAKEQTELVRIADIGIKKSTRTESKNLAVIVKQTLSTDQAETVAYLAGTPNALSKKALTGNLDPKTDKKLTDAEQSNQFDEAFMETLELLLIDYQKDVRETLDNTQSKKAETLLTDLYESINIIIGKTSAGQIE